LRAVGWSKIQWGDAPTWLGVLLALAAGVVAYAVYRIESGRDRDTAARVAALEDERNRTQANQVCAWYTDVPDDRFSVMGPDGRRWGALVRNASDLPVFDVRVTYHHKADWLSEPSKKLGFSTALVVPPGEPAFLEAPSSIYIDGKRATYVVGLTFRDAAGRLWLREVDGELTFVAKAKLIAGGPGESSQDQPGAGEH
jgi:hypothetical protein